MGNEQSSSQSNDWGFHVLRVVVNSAAANAGIEPWFDYICGVNSTKIDESNAHLLGTTVKSASEQKLPITFSVYSAKGGTVRDVYIEPTEELGLSLRWCPLASSGNVWHVLEVHPSSPAEIAGFIPYNDYIIGSPEGALVGESALGELVEQFLRRPLRFWVYNSTYDIVRTVTIVPDRNWGGEGAMGFNIGFGYLHRIPALASNDVVFESSEAPMQTAFQLAQAQTQEGQDASSPSTERKSSDLSRPPVHGRRRPSHSASHSVRNVAGIEDILREGQEKSAKEDFVTSTKSADSLPPPPPKRATSHEEKKEEES